MGRARGRRGRRRPGGTSHRRPRAERPRRALWSLPEEQRIALALVDLGGLSTREASEIMGTPRGTVLSRLHRARKALASVLEPEIVEKGI
ncbi:MAG TPA: sigma factor-like helix-turn-helix DNA-binding protein [Actinomycetota bacterium]|nr:sigma factor-like helix-turn-helix DNA-binding protein [Actinomycetota bacterium]